MNVGFFVSNLQSYSGASFQALALAKNFPKSITVFFFNKSSNSGFKVPYLHDGFLVVDLPANRIFQFLVSLYYSIKWSVSIFHMHGFSLAAFLSSKLLFKRSILKTTLIGYDDFKSILSMPNGKLRLFLAKQVSINVVLTKRAYQINYGLKGESQKVVIIPNGVFIDRRVKTPIDVSPVFCIVGVIHSRKRTLDAINYYIKNYSSLPNSKLLIVGPLTNDYNLEEFSQEYINQCKQLVSTSSMEHQIKFLGKLSKDAVQDIYKNSLSLLFFSKNEGMPNVVLEALANNCVPIMTDLGGDSYEILEHGKSGFIVKNMKDMVPVEDVVSVKLSGATLRNIKSYAFKSIANKYIGIYNSKCYDKKNF